MFDDYLALWNLTPDGEPVVTAGGEPAMLKVATEPEERFGGRLMGWWDGDGAALVLAMRRDAILLERARGRRPLADLARGGRDDEATRIICDVVARLHAPRREAGARSRSAAGLVSRAGAGGRHLRRRARPRRRASL